jgi:CheY-like chemotaxis protein
LGVVPVLRSGWAMTDVQGYPRHDEPTRRAQWGGGVGSERPGRLGPMTNDRQTSHEPHDTVLIVDDHDGFRALARKLLEAAGFIVTEAANGTDAAEAAGRARPMLVLVDVQLPDINGFEVARRIARQAAHPIVVLTSTRDASDYGEQVASSPAAGFLPKEQLSAAALRRYLTGDPT